MSAEVEIAALFDGEDFSSECTRADFEKMCKPYFDEMIALIDVLLTDLKLKKTEIADVVMIGGSTRIPKVRKLVEDYFGYMPNITCDPDLAVAAGACLEAFKL